MYKKTENQYSDPREFRIKRDRKRYLRSLRINFHDKLIYHQDTFVLSQHKKKILPDLRKFEQDVDCSICYESLKGCFIRDLQKMKCGHVFHEKCSAGEVLLISILLLLKMLLGSAEYQFYHTVVSF